MLNRSGEGILLGILSLGSYFTFLWTIQDENKSLEIPPNR
jgi:hypothetical protein